MKTSVLLAILGSLALAPLGGCSGCGNDHGGETGDAGVDAPTFDQCAADPAAFVRQAFLALDGHRPRSQGEVDVYVDIYKAAQAKQLDAKDIVARAIMARPEFTERWVDTFMDAMKVQRTDIQSEQACWDKGLRNLPVGPALATAVRGQRATTSGDGQAWTMLDLARSSLALDDVTPMYRAQVFSMVARPIPAANVGQVEAELARRADFGATFDSGFLHRDLVCLSCHTSEHSVTDNDDPALDRFWPAPGLPEKAVYGMSEGVAEDRAHAMFRVDGFLTGNANGARPWGWSNQYCDTFVNPANVGNDPADVDAKLATITGKRSTVYDLEAALGRGFDVLRGNPPPIGPDGAIADPEVALAWLVTLKMTEDVWKQATGTSLTIANYFPRNEAAQQLLTDLATKYTTSGYSLRALLAAIVSSDYFNRLAPELACGDGPYTYPNVYDPWVIADADPAKRKNGPGDAVTAIDARTLVQATNAALEWSLPPAASRFADYGDGCDDVTCASAQQACNGFGACCNTSKACQAGGVAPSTELPFQRGVGMFLRNSEAGFRGLDFQARLVWENRYGKCTRPTWVTQDFIDRLVAAGAADATATTGDVVSALKDRLIGEPALTDAAETAALATIIGPLDAPASSVTATTLRQVCGALVGSPQFLLQGIAGRGGERPKLTPVDAGYDAVCTELAGRGAAGHVVTCGAGSLTLD